MVKLLPDIPSFYYYELHQRLLMRFYCIRCQVMREKDTVNLKTRAWVRLKKGVYKDDLGQVDFVDTAQNSVHLKLIPR